MSLHLGTPSAEQLSRSLCSCISSPACPHTWPLLGHVPKASSQECLQLLSLVDGLGFPEPGKPGVEAQEHKGEQQVFKTGVLTAPCDIRCSWSEVGTVRVVKNNSPAG